MNYYPHHIGDYSRDTAHLSMLEDAAYRRMLDLYYASERPLPLNREGLCRLVRAQSEEEKLAVSIVLGEFFTETKKGWIQKRVEIEIAKAKTRTQAAQENGKKGGRPLTQSVSQQEPSDNPAGLRSETQVKAPNNQKPLTKTNTKEERAETPRSRGSRLPADWKPSEILEAWAFKERPDLDLRVTAERFKNHWLSKAGKDACKLDWELTFRNWVLAERAGSKPKEIDHEAFAKRIEEEDRKNAGV